MSNEDTIVDYLKHQQKVNMRLADDTLKADALRLFIVDNAESSLRALLKHVRDHDGQSAGAEVSRCVNELWTKLEAIETKS